jgi:hypothetical protein
MLITDGDRLFCEGIGGTQRVFPDTWNVWERTVQLYDELAVPTQSESGQTDHDAH